MKTKNLTITFAIEALAMMVIAGCVNETVLPFQTDASQVIIASNEEELTKTCIETEIDETTPYVAVLWTPSDELGVFTDKEQNVRYTKYDQSKNEKIATFVASETVTGTPQFAYYPYNESAGTSMAALAGNLPEIQTMDPEAKTLPGDHKIGVLKNNTTNGSEFRFTHLFSPVRIIVNGVGTTVSNDQLEGIDLTVSREGVLLPLAGSFTFNAQSGSYTLDRTSNMITFDWSTKPSLNTQAMAYGTMFPNVRKGDIMTFVIRTSQYKATVRVTSKVDFYANRLYTFPLDLSNLVANTTIEKNNATSGGSGDIEGTLSELGTFTVATFNVDGLPDISYIVDSTNPNGPGASGTTTMANRIASENPQWDIIGFSEDFANHSQLTAGLSSAYTFGTYRGSVSEAQLVSTADTDGLGFATRNTACSFSNEKIVEFTSSHGGLTSGANTCIKKGFRHYIVTLADGTAIDVLITHMNTYSGSGTDHINAQHAQLRQIALYVNSIRDNKRPIIFMGDTNCRYTRHDFQTYFWNVLDKDLIVNDPWVEFQWTGVYPQYPSKSYMVEDATGTDPAYDIIYKGHQKGEVVDKVIYINNPDAPIQIVANSYLRSYDNYKGLGDHMPIVVNFSYGKIAATSASTVVGVDSWDEELDLL